MIQTTTPISDTIVSGTVENAMIPSNAYRNNFQNDHFVSPAARSTFSNSIHFVLNPTHPKIPFVNRLYYGMERIALTISLFIIRKSLAPSTISASEILLINP